MTPALRALRAAIVVAPLLFASIASAQVSLVINEFVVDHTGTDTNEYVEVYGAASTDYSGFTIVEIEGDGTSSGLIDDGIFQVGTTDANGHWVTPFQNNVIENGTVTLLLVTGFTGSVGDDIDTNNDGVIDNIYWTTIFDCVSSHDGGGSDFGYCDTVLDDSLAPAGFQPGGASRIPDGTDTNSAADWVRNDFDGAGIPALDPGTPDDGEALNTPGAENELVGGQAVDPLINEFVLNHTGSDDNEYVEIIGSVNADYSAFTIIEIEGDVGGTGLIDDGTFAVGSTDANGYWTTGYQVNVYENGSVTLLLVEGYNGTLLDDIDTDDDGVIDAVFWSRIVDCVAVVDGGASDLTYCGTELDSSLPPAGFTPGGASRIPNGTDTDTAADWARNDFDGAGIPALDPGSPDAGEALNTPNAENALVAGPAPELVINEIMQNPSAVGDGTGEWFELYNAGADPVDINGWAIADNGSDSHVINNGGPLVINPGTFLVLGNNADSGINGGLVVNYSYGTSHFLANGDDELVLLDGSATEVDRVEWDGGPAFPDPTGASMALIDPSFDNNTGANWCEATTPYGDGDSGTPGAVNDCDGSPVQFLINEVDADTEGVDGAEFIEIYDGGAGNSPLDGLVLVLFNGSDDASYEAFDLDGQSTNAEGYFVLCGNAANVANCDLDATPDTDLIQNGADAVALFTGDATDFPNDTPVTTTGLLDAIVYDTNDGDDAGLLPLLNAGQPQVNEDGAGNKDFDSNQRCPNGTGGPRNTNTYEQWIATPGEENVCEVVVGPPVCGDTQSATFISAVQGTGNVSPLEGQVVEIEGIVVGDLQGVNEYGGLFVQEEDADADGDPLSSEGIFVFTNLPADLGDQVRVRGTVVEFFELTEISPTTDLVVCATGATPPTPVAVTMPMASADEYEAYESMAVTFAQSLVINANFRLFEFGEVTLSSTRLTTPTAVAAPGGPANALADANALDMLILDDRRTGDFLLPPVIGQDDTNPLAANNTVRSGATVNGLQGVMHYSFGSYRVQPTAPYTIDETANPRPVTPDDVGGTLQVAAFNVLNFFTTLDTGAPVCGPSGNQGCRGANNAGEYTRQLDKLTTALLGLDADVVGLVELENNASDSLQAIVDALNATLGAGAYDFIDTGTIGDDVIKVGFIYKPASVTPEGAFAVLDSSVDARFDDSLNRPSLAQSFRSNDNLALFTTIVNHLKSKGCGGATGANDDQGDGQGCWNPVRTSAAEALRDWANGDATGVGTDSVLILGDLNSYFMEDPVETLINGGFTSLEFAFGGPDSYTYTFSAQKGSLDYALSSTALTPKVTGAAPWNINADEPLALDYNTEDGKPANFYAVDPYRTSDHDPIVVGMELNPPQTLTIPTLAPGVEAFIEIAGAGDKCGFSAAEFVDPASVSPAPPANLTFPYGVLQFTAESCTAGATADVSITLPQIPDLLAWYKFTTATGWTTWQYQLAGNIFTYQVTDGGSGDEDGTVNSVIIDPAGPAIVAAGDERATFRVTKDFDDDNPAEVEVSLSCNTGLPLEQFASIAEGEHVEFVIGSFTVGEMDCAVSEVVPDGYAPAHSAALGVQGIAGSVVSSDTSCDFIDVSNGQFTCAISNTLEPVEIIVNKEWIDDNPEYNMPQFAWVEVQCDVASWLGGQYINPNGPGKFVVYPFHGGESCTVSEDPEVGVLADLEDCEGLMVAPGQDAECTVVNTRLYAGIPTLSQYGLALLALMMLMIGVVSVRRFA